MTVFDKITALQKGKENTAPWMVGEQLKDICRREPACAKIVEEDLENKEMSLEECAKAIQKHADELHKKTKGKCICVPPNVAEGIIRKFYGLPEAGETEPAPKAESSLLNLDDLL